MLFRGSQVVSHGRILSIATIHAGASRRYYFRGVMVGDGQCPAGKPLRATWQSTRRRQTEDACGNQGQKYRDDHEREPGEWAAYKLGLIAADRTRRPKGSPRPLSELRAPWRASAIRAVGVDVFDRLLQAAVDGYTRWIKRALTDEFRFLYPKDINGSSAVRPVTLRRAASHYERPSCRRRSRRPDEGRSPLSARAVWSPAPRRKKVPSRPGSWSRRNGCYRRTARPARPRRAASPARSGSRRPALPRPGATGVSLRRAPPGGQDGVRERAAAFRLRAQPVPDPKTPNIPQQSPPQSAPDRGSQTGKPHHRNGRPEDRDLRRPDPGGNARAGSRLRFAPAARSERRPGWARSRRRRRWCCTCSGSGRRRQGNAASPQGPPVGPVPGRAASAAPPPARPVPDAALRCMAVVTRQGTAPGALHCARHPGRCTRCASAPGAYRPPVGR